jgi:hypothetical protein
MTVPAQPRLYHITHVDNLPAILAAGGLQSDAAMIARGGPAASIGMSTIEMPRSMVRLSVPCKARRTALWWKCGANGISE